MIHTKKITIDLARPFVNDNILLHEGDVNGSALKIDVYNNGEAFDLTGFTVEYDATIAGYLAEMDAAASTSENTITVPVKETMTAYSGLLKIDVKICKNSEVLFFRTIEANVQSRIINNATPVDPSDRPVSQFVKDIENIVRGGVEYSSPDTEFTACKDKVEDYLALPDYSPDDYSYSNIPSDITNNHYDRPNGIDIEIPTGSVTIVLRDAVTEKEWRETVSGTVHRIENLIPGHLYTYTFLDNSENAVKTGTCKAIGHVRMINGGGNTYNIRDIGGWACDGGRLKYGKIFRGSELNAHVTALTPEQIYLFKDTLDICDEIDLRSDNGAAGITDTALGIGVGYIRVPLPYYTNILSNTTAGNGPELTAQIMHRIIGNLRDGKVSYIHCEAGADRTATVAMLIETVCGVSLSDLDRDYELTSFSFGPSGAQNTRRRSDGTDTTANWKTLIARIKTLEGDTFQNKVIRFLLRCGVSIDELNDLRDCLIDGEPEKLVNPYGTAAITRNLTNIHTENSRDSVVLYQPFETLIIADNMCKITSLSVTMGGMNASKYLSNEKLSIPVVTGDIVITGVASALDVYTKTEIDSMIGDIETDLSQV